MNEWFTADFTEPLDPSDAKTELIGQLYKVLNKTSHSLPDLSLRKAQSPNNGLCGLAALYKALYDTILTKAALKQMGYIDMRTKISEEISKMENGLDANLLLLDDTELLKRYFKGICLHFLHIHYNLTYHIYTY